MSISSTQYVYDSLKSQGHSRFLRVEKKYPEPLEGRPVKDWTYEIFQVKRSDAPAFEAVSYVWGSAKRSHTLELVDGRTFLTTASCFTALPYLAARSVTGYLWIDQICINQDDIPERNSQVQIMGSIYQRAEQVLAWLGELNRTEATYLMELIQTTEKARKNTEPHKIDRENPEVISKISSMMSLRPGNKMYLNTLVELLSRPWFRRGWIFQEAVLCKSIILLAGDAEINGLGALDALVTAISQVDDKIEEFNLYSTGLGYQGIMDLSRERTQRHGEVHSVQSRTFSEFLSETAGKEVTDPRDHVYGFLGLQSDPDITIVPDYSLSVERVFAESAKSIIAGSRGLNLVGALRRPGILLGEAHGLPSWVPDWSLRIWFYPLCKSTQGAYSPSFNASMQRTYKSAADSKVAWNQIVIRGLQVDSVTYVTVRPFPTTRTTRSESVKRRLSLAIQMAQLAKDCPLIGKVSEERLLKVLLADGSTGAYGPIEGKHPLSTDDVADLLSQYHKICAENTTVSPASFDPTVSLLSVEFNAAVERLFYYSQAAVNRRVFCTVGGRLGLAPYLAKIDDQVVIADGSRTPLILRSTGSVGQYWLVGECYLEGAMYGELCTWLESESTEFFLV